MSAGICVDALYLALIAAPIHEASFPHHQSSTVHVALSASQRVRDCYLTVHPDNFEGGFSSVRQSIPIVPCCPYQIQHIRAR